MRIFFKISHWLIGLLLVVSTAFQLLAMFSVIAKSDLLTTMPWLVPVWAAMLVLLIAAFVLLVKKGDTMPWPPIILAGALVAAVAAFVIAITLRDAFPDHLDINGETQGLTNWRMMYRHMSSALGGALTAIIAGVRWALCRLEARLAADAAADRVTSTIGLDAYAGDENATAPRRKKRSLRKKQ